MANSIPSTFLADTYFLVLGVSVVDILNSKQRGYRIHQKYKQFGYGGGVKSWKSNFMNRKIKKILTVIHGTTMTNHISITDGHVTRTLELKILE